MTELLWLNGQFSPLHEGRVSVLDRGFHFADGIYEVIAVYAGRMRAPEYHLDRLERSAAGIQLRTRLARAPRREVLQRLIDDSGAGDALIYGQVTRGAALRAHPFPAPETEPTELWWIRPLPTVAPDDRARGLDVITLPDERWANCCFKTIGLLPNCLAAEKARAARCHEAILIAEDGTVREGASTNLFAVVDGELRTHPLTRRILPGVTRRLVVELAGHLGFPAVERAISDLELRRADEVFLTSTTKGVAGVGTIDGRPVGTGGVGPTTRLLEEAYFAMIEELRGAQALAAR
ncbi:MAG: aminotransferase class IV [Candidatus Sumerlaeia bacterium]|nr:aminotransferase class IV [Candidatus Sumerlaeia bacterium]